MKRVVARALCLALFVSAASTASSYASVDLRASVRSPGSQISISYFYDNLSPDGEWFQEPSYGWVWTPYNTSPNWRPYYDGHWVYTDYGWSWVSNERWGWATYHYGRWIFEDSYGWVWVPGRVWAPSWVAWRYGDDWVGWAPLPPGADWDDSRGLSFGDVNSIPSRDWCFVPQTHVLDVNIRLQVTSVSRNVTLLQRSRDVTRFQVRGGRPANVGIDVAQIEKRVRRPVPRVKIVDVDTPARGGGRPVGKGGLGFYRPAVQPAGPNQRPPHAVTERRTATPNAAVKRRKAAGSGAEVRRRHAVEQPAPETHATQQRHVPEPGVQKRTVRPDRPKVAQEPAPRGKPQAQDKGQTQEKSSGQPQERGQRSSKGKPQDKGQTEDKGQTQDKGHGKSSKQGETP